MGSTRHPAIPGAMTVEPVAIDRLRPDPANPRRITEAEVAALTRSLTGSSFVQPLLTRRERRRQRGSRASGGATHVAYRKGGERVWDHQHRDRAAGGDEEREERAPGLVRRLITG